MITSAIIGLLSGLLVIIVIGFLKFPDKKVIYGLILTGIGFIYVGFTWSDKISLIITSIQAIFFLFLAYYGIKRNLLILAAGYFLHGIWDFTYDLLRAPDLIPPHYDWFCLTIDFTMGACLLTFKFRPVR